MSEAEDRRAQDPEEGWALAVPARGAEAEVLADRLWQLGASAVAEEGPTLVAGFAAETTARAAARWLSATGTEGRLIPDDGAWRSAWRAFAPDVVVGPLTIRIVDRAAGGGVSERDATDGAEGVLTIDPGDRFGSGHHPTTRQCLRAVVRLAGPGVSVLDLGTGSGILALAAAAKGAERVVAVDVDPRAARGAAGNAAANGLRVAVACGTMAGIRDRFDVVVANLGGAEAPVALAPNLGAAVAPAGHLVLGGMLDQQAAVVRDAYRRWGSVTAESEAGWTCLTVTRATRARS